MNSRIKCLTIPVFILIFSSMLYGCSRDSTSNSKAEVSSSESISSTESQSNDSVSQNQVLEKVYTQAIGDYIKFVKAEYNLAFDTLFLGKREFGEADDFPDIKLPAVIENTNIRLISPEEGMRIQSERKSSYYINLIGWVNESKAEFIFVTFSNGFAHQFDCVIHYNNQSNNQVFEVSDFHFTNFQYSK